MSDTDHSGETALVLFVLAIAGAALFLLAMMASAPGGDICLSKEQARHLWPTQHIWWFRDKQTGNHCWSNRRGPPHGLKIEPEHKPKIHIDPALPARAGALPVVRAEAPLRSDQPLRIIEDGCCWPALTEFDRRFVGDKE